MGCGCLVSLSCAHIGWYDTKLCHRFKYGIFRSYWIKDRDFLECNVLNLVRSGYVRTTLWQFVDRCLTWGSGCVYRSYCNVMGLFLLSVNSKMPHCTKKRWIYITSGNWLLSCTALWFPILAWWMTRATSGFFTIKLESFVHYYNVAACKICCFIVRTYHFGHFCTYKQVKFPRPVHQSICLLVRLRSCWRCTCWKTNNPPHKQEKCFYHFLTYFQRCSNMSTSVSTVNTTPCLTTPANTVTSSCTYGQVCLCLCKFVSRGVPVILFSLATYLLVQTLQNIKLFSMLNQ
jgi:hypothetical protein